jgi:Sulfotransferase domain
MARYPGFLVIGAMRSGTTSLYEDLCLSPKIFMPSVKEPNYLSKDCVLEPRGRRKYLSLFSPARVDQVCGEASTCYTQIPAWMGVPHRTSIVVGKSVRLLYIVRNPFSRLMSHYKFLVKWDKCNLPLGDALRAFPSLVNFSCYGMQLAAWLDIFDAENVLVLKFEEYFLNRKRCYDDVLKFLGVNDTVTKIETNRVYNASDDNRVPRPLVYRMLSRGHFYERFLKRRIPELIKPTGKRLLSKKPSECVSFDVSEADLHKLRRIFADDARHLQRLLGTRAPVWDDDVPIDLVSNSPCQ